jgi:hypothetical protein
MVCQTRAVPVLNRHIAPTAKMASQTGWPGGYASRTDDFCASGDPVCQSGGTNVLAHLSYTGDAPAAAALVR